MSEAKQEGMFVTLFIDENDRRLGSIAGLLPLPLFKGMTITIHGVDGMFEVTDWIFHLGHPDENAGLRIHLRRKR